MGHSYLYRDLSLYDTTELRDAVRPDPGTAADDESLLLDLCRQRGSAGLSLLDGDFAFAIRDTGTGRILAARDPFGIRPLYYTRIGTRVRFAGSIGELLALPGVEKTPNHAAIARLLSTRAIRYEETLFEGIFRVPPGHALEIDARESRLHRYWTPEKIPPAVGISWPEASEIFLRLLERAIRIRMGSEEETAFEVSGGLDSSSLVALSRTRMAERPLHAYSMVFPGMECDESRYLGALETRYGSFVRRCDAAGIDYRRRYGPEYTLRLNPWWPVTTTFSMYAPMAERMREEGRRIVLTGQGGDHLLWGSCHTLADLLRRGAYRAAWDELLTLPRAMVALKKSCFLPRRRIAPLKVLAGRSSRRQEEAPRLFPLEGEVSPATRALLATLISPAESMLRDGNLFHPFEEEYGLRYRHPFFDRRLAEFVVSLPPEFLHSKGWSKALLRYAMEGMLPGEILSRRDKAEFGAVLSRRLGAMEWESLLKDSRLLARGMADPVALERAVKAYRTDRGDWGSLWNLVQVELWYRRTFEECRW